MVAYVTLEVAEVQRYALDAHACSPPSSQAIRRQSELAGIRRKVLKE